MSLNPFSIHWIQSIWSHPDGTEISVVFWDCYCWSGWCFETVLDCWSALCFETVLDCCVLVWGWFKLITRCHNEAAGYSAEGWKPVVITTMVITNYTSKSLSFPQHWSADLGLSNTATIELHSGLTTHSLLYRPKHVCGTVAHSQCCTLRGDCSCLWDVDCHNLYW